MNTESRPARRGSAVVSSLLAASLMTPVLAGCGRSGGNYGAAGSNVQAPPTQTYGSVPAPANARRNQGMSTGQKAALLTGAAALYYLYNKHKNAKGTGVNGQYYRSKNGRIYYRDANGNAVYVTPPAGGIPVPAEEAERYNRAAQSGDFGVLDSGGYNSGNMSGSGSGNMGGMNGMNGNMGGYSNAPAGPRGAGAGY